MSDIGEILRVTDRDPALTTKLNEFDFYLDDQGAHFVELKRPVVSVWVHYRKRRPTLWGEPWDSTQRYAAGSQVYYVGTGATILPTVGNFFNANQATTFGESPETAPAKWEVVEIPYFLRAWLIRAGFSDWLMGDGQAAKAQQTEAQAYRALELEADKLNRQQGQSQRIKWRT